MIAISRNLSTAAVLVVLAGAGAVRPTAADTPPPEMIPIADAANAGDLVEAERRAAAFLESARTADDPVRTAWALLAAGDVLFYRGDYLASLDRYERGAALFREAGAGFGLAAARKNRGIALKSLGRVEEGVAELEAVIPAMRELGSERELASAIENAATGYLQLGDGIRAHAYLREALELAERADDEFARFHTLTRLAVLHLHTGSPERAIDAAGRARAAAERLGLRLDLGWAESIEASALLRLGRVAEARRLQVRAVERAEAMDNPVYSIEPYRVMGRLAAADDPRSALEWYARSGRAAGAVGMPTPWWLELDIGEALRALGELDPAIASLRRAVVGVERDRGRIAAERYRTGFGDAHGAAYRALVSALLDRARHGDGDDDVRSAFAAVERASARSLVEQIEIAHLGPGPELDETLARALDDVDRAIAARQSELVRPETTSPRRAAILAELDDLEAEWARLASEVRRRDPRWAKLRFPEPVDVDGASALVPADAAIAVWFELSDGLAAFVLARGRIDAVRIDVPLDSLATRVDVLLETMSDRAGAWRPVARRLHADLFDPVERLLPAGIRRLVIVPDGVLHFLPFEALLDEHGGDRFLVERYAVSYAPSVTALAGLRDRAEARRSGERSDMLLLADPTIGAGTAVAREFRTLYDVEGLTLGPLPFSATEARRVARFARHAEVLLGPQATESRLRAAPLDDYRVLHFATHGAVSVRRPWRSALVLTGDGAGGDDGLLQVREIYGLRLAAELVVLSACRTARGRVLSGEGVEGLARAFLHAGSRSVVASVVDVPDERTASLMTAFYDRLSRGRTAADALREAKLAALSDGAPPGEWAGFVVVGDGATTVALRRPGGPWTGLIALVALLTLTLAAVAAVRARTSP